MEMDQKKGEYFLKYHNTPTFFLFGTIYGNGPKRPERCRYRRYKSTRMATLPPLRLSKRQTTERNVFSEERNSWLLLKSNQPNTKRLEVRRLGFLPIRSMVHFPHSVVLQFCDKRLYQGVTQ